MTGGLDSHALEKLSREIAIALEPTLTELREARRLLVEARERWEEILQAAALITHDPSRGVVRNDAVFHPRTGEPIAPDP